MLKKATKELAYSLLPKQLEFISVCECVPHAAYIGAFGSGKSHVLCIQALLEASKPSFGLIGAPTYRLLSDTTMRKFWQLCPREWIVDFHKSENRVTLINGSEIIFRSLDNPERLTNLELDWFALDEIGEIELETFRMLQGRLRRHGGSHHGFGVGNPAGPSHWTYEYFVIKAADAPDQYRLVQATSYENTFLPSSYTKNMEVSYGKDSMYFKRFVLGQFVAFSGAYWPDFDVRPYPDGHVLEMDQIASVLSPEFTWRFGRAIDFGYEHPFVCMWFVSDGRTVVFFDEYYQRHMTIREHCLNMRHKELENQKLPCFGIHDYSISYTDHDAQARAEIAAATDEDNKAIGFDCVPADKKVMEGILLVQTMIREHRLFITTRCVEARKEIPSYRARPMEGNKKCVDEKPIKEHDDCADAVRMACASEMHSSNPFARPDSLRYDFTRLAPDQGLEGLEGLVR